MDNCDWYWTKFQAEKSSPNLLSEQSGDCIGSHVLIDYITNVVISGKELVVQTRMIVKGTLWNK